MKSHTAEMNKKEKESSLNPENEKQNKLGIQLLG